MSTAFSNVFNSHSSQVAADSRFKFASAPVSYNQLASSSGTQQLPLTQNVVSKPPPNPLLSLKKVINPKRNAEEIEIIKETAKKVKERILQDQNAVLHPDVDTPFEDELDVIKRLLPYHIYQQPRDDLELLISGKGKEKALDQDLKDEIRDTKVALDCAKRKKKIIDRWREVNVRTAKRSSPDDQAYYLAQVVVDGDRSENAWLSSELRTARSELERIERDKRAAATAARMSQFSTTPQHIAPSMQTQYYRAYPYAYTQAYGTAPTSTGSTVASTAPTMATFSATPTPAPTPPTPSPYLPNGAIPVQLPVASLPALHALGIVPVPAASLSAGLPQPAAVLRGSTANGTLLSLEINVSLLQSTQMTGLAMVLNSLVAKTQNAAAATASAATAAHTPQNTSIPVKQPDSRAS
ncbi:hypothetical protein CPB83DRAFT_812168 [Crepidotus variabilis]|uniref:GLTSCR protein conserved domain-containing protein n=1 Tax=Crepidotus variabilis TaxID=179855 RepID=A0A9P6JQ91_9AGAR|nr:hypothetical protein CPB83DRAFT_812168 [Crepidotus variabilis]